MPQPEHEVSVIKSIEPRECPQCKAQLFVAFQTSPPVLTQVFSEKELSQARALARERINNSDAAKETKERAVEQANDLLMGIEDVANVVDGLLNP